MSAALSDLVDAHVRWLRSHPDEADADEWLYHYDALTCLWRAYA